MKKNRKQGYSLREIKADMLERATRDNAHPQSLRLISSLKSRKMTLEYLLTVLQCNPHEPPFIYDLMKKTINCKHSDQKLILASCQDWLEEHETEDDRPFYWR
jgi:hypothetical protein